MVVSAFLRNHRAFSTPLSAFGCRISSRVVIAVYNQKHPTIHHNRSPGPSKIPSSFGSESNVALVVAPVMGDFFIGQIPDDPGG